MKSTVESLELTLVFNPDQLEDTEENAELILLFKQGGIGLKFWAAYKTHHLTSQHFLPGCLQLNLMYSLVDTDVETEQETIDWSDPRVVKQALEAKSDSWPCGNSDEWFFRYWDCFNINIQRAITLIHKEGDTTYRKTVRSNRIRGDQ